MHPLLHVHHQTGVIVNLLHLRKVLGRKGRDLLPKERKREMLLYLVRNRMLLTRNEDADYDGTTSFSASSRTGNGDDESVTGPWVPPPPRENPWLHEDAIAGRQPPFSCPNISPQTSPCPLMGQNMILLMRCTIDPLT